MTALSQLRLASLTALSCVMLTACGHVSPRSRPPEPVVVTRLQPVQTCPAEARLKIEPVPAVPEGAVISANQAGHDWIAELYVYAASMFDRATDTRAACETDHE